MGIQSKKEELLKNGYTTFNVKDFKEFEKYYEKFSYFKNEGFLEKIKNKVNGFKFDSHSLNKSGDAYEYQIDGLSSFDITYERAHNLYLDSISKNFLIEQYWYFYNGHIIDWGIFNNLAEDISKQFYDFETDDFDFNKNCTVYLKNCFLKKHTDGVMIPRMFAILFYLNENYKEEWGGNLILDDKVKVTPEYGNVAIIDFTKHNASHEVSEVVDGPGRYALISFVSSNKYWK